MQKRDSLFETITRDIDENTPFAEIARRADERFGIDCAPLVLDSSCFTRTLRQGNLVLFLSLIHKLRNEGDRIFRQNGALDVRVEADNMFAEFPSVDTAVTSAFMLHSYFEENRFALSQDADKTFSTCIGIGWGRMLQSDHEGVYGYEMNLASRLGEDVAGPGETLLTEAAFRHLTRAVRSEKRTFRESDAEWYYHSVSPEPGAQE